VDSVGGGGEAIGGGGGFGGGHVVRAASQKVAATMRLRIERVQEGVALACRKAIRSIEILVATPDDRMLVEFSEVGLTQSEHLLVAIM
jgi:hypothetical protein